MLEEARCTKMLENEDVITLKEKTLHVRRYVQVS